MGREVSSLQRNGHGQAWYLARHLKRLSADLAASGFSEASLLVGAAAISVGDQSVEQRETPPRSPAVVEKFPLPASHVRHG